MTRGGSGRDQVGHGLVWLIRYTGSLPGRMGINPAKNIVIKKCTPNTIKLLSSNARDCTQSTSEFRPALSALFAIILISWFGKLQST